MVAGINLDPKNHGSPGGSRSRDSRNASRLPDPLACGAYFGLSFFPPAPQAHEAQEAAAQQEHGQYGKYLVHVPNGG